MLSQDKITHMSHVLLRGLLERSLVKLKEEPPKVRRAIRLAIEAELKVAEEIDQLVRRKLQSMSRRIPEGSPEWEVLYRKFYQEEEQKRGRVG
jgi:hypothetical protein